MKRILISIALLNVLSACNETTPQSPTKDNTSAKDTTAQNKSEEAKVENLLHTANQIQVGNDLYKLTWSANPSEGYYKQEYLPQGQQVSKFTEMVLVELLVGEISSKEVLSAKIKEIEARKTTDAIANYQVSENTKDQSYLLDFLVSEGNGDDNTIVEWNAYRFKEIVLPSGEKATLLFALIKRGYGTAVIKFMENIKTERMNYVNTFVSLPWPQVRPIATKP